MDTLRTDIIMPSTYPTAFQEILDAIVKITPWIAATTAFWKALDFLAKYLEDTRKSRVEEIVKPLLEKLPYTGQIEQLNHSVNELNQSIGVLSEKIKNM